MPGHFGGRDLLFGRAAPPAHVAQGGLFQIRQEAVDPAARLMPVGPPVRITGPDESPSAGGKASETVVMSVCGNADLLEVILALVPPGGFPGRLNGRQQEGHQNAHDGDHYQHFDEGERALF